MSKRFRFLVFLVICTMGFNTIAFSKDNLVLSHNNLTTSASEIFDHLHECDVTCSYLDEVHLHECYDELCIYPKDLPMVNTNLIVHEADLDSDSFFNSDLPEDNFEEIIADEENSETSNPEENNNENNLDENELEGEDNSLELDEKELDEEEIEPTESEEKELDDLKMSEEDQDAIAYIAYFMNIDSSEIGNITTLYDVNDEPGYLLVEFTTGGYAVMMKDSFMITEYSRNAHSPYQQFEGEKLYYLGLLSYYYQVGNDLYNIHDGDILSASDAAKFKETQMFYKEVAEGLMSYQFSHFSIQSSSANIISNAMKVRSLNFGNNSGPQPPGFEGGSCGPLAVSMLLEYYDAIYNDNFVPSSLETSYHNDDKLYHHIRSSYSLSTAPGGGTISSDDAFALNYWLGDDATRQNLGFQAQHELVSVSGVKQSIDNDNPTLLYLFNDPDFGNHVVIAYGYEVIDSLTYFYIHPGHHTKCVFSGGRDTGIMSEIIVNASLAYGGGVWLETNTSHTHNFSNGYSLIDENKHFYQCTQCNLIKSESHSWVAKTVMAGYNDHYNVCSKCGYTTPTCGGTVVYNAVPGTSTHAGTCIKCGMTNINTASHKYDSTSYSLMTTTSHTKTCTVCYNRTSENHSFPFSFTSYSSTQHSKKCSDCGYLLLQNHNYLGTWSKASDSQHSMKCSSCSYVKYESHSWGSWGQGTSSQHTRKCSSCSATQSGAHSYSSWKDNGLFGHVRSCNTCGRSETGNHSYMGLWTKVDSNYHSRSCSQCGKTEKVAHSLSYGMWSNVGTMFACRERTVNCYSCFYFGKETDTNHSIDFSTKKCTKCGYNRGY